MILIFAAKNGEDETRCCDEGDDAQKWRWSALQEAMSKALNLKKNSHNKIFLKY